MAIWQLRKAFFHGADTYTLTSDTGAKITLKADGEGYFSVGPVDFPLGVFAKSVDVASEKKRLRASQ